MRADLLLALEKRIRCLFISHKISQDVVVNSRLALAADETTDDVVKHCGEARAAMPADEAGWDRRCNMPLSSGSILFNIDFYGFRIRFPLARTVFFRSSTN